MVKYIIILLLFIFNINIIFSAVYIANIENIDYTVGQLKLYFNGSNLDKVYFNDTTLVTGSFIDLNSSDPNTYGYYQLTRVLTPPYIIEINEYQGGDLINYTPFVHNCLNDCSGANGKCNMTIMKCECNDGWGGTDCSIDQTFTCLNNCSGNGKCNQDMSCNCNDGYNGVSCNLYTPSLGLSMKMNKSSTQPEIVIGQFDMDSTNKTLSMNQFSKSSNYSIFISYIQEVDLFENVIKIFNLTQSQWTLLSTNSTISVYETELTEGSIITAQIELFQTDTQRVWANQTMIIPGKSIKYSIRIQNYTFTSNLNKLQMFYQATPNAALECAIKQQIAWGAKRSTDMHWVTLPNNQLQLYGRFSNYMILDDRIVSTSNEGLEFGSTIQVKVNIPFFKDYVELDPDFSVLVDVDMDTKVYDQCGNVVNKGSRKWVIPVSVIVSVVGATMLFVIVFSVFYSKNTNLRLKILSLKSKVGKRGRSVSMS